ncbi:hypothetical protein GFS31_31780 [Leptolyngbya sp. BL0902]|uniref:Tab2/Atab2 family RNA-binding protein n=1 Tax=Leptolyngbya sp. BL0902 TaxID=1115757 RepID=UPI0018E7C33D|nr:Tab2/Atab2 family RNA-binding protein [Leptolyngbya sp. BL0902]QQE66480.1 hypothetical protein GFS31_31780 [Leptolyngbya sp. BL0902]
MGTVWELDFYSRPLLDENNKRRWEVLVCEGVVDIQADPAQSFRYSKFVSNTEVNSNTLQAALEEAIAQAPTPPSAIRYFRYQMQNMIQRACDGLGLPARPSRRTLALNQWLTERNQSFYPQQEGYTSAPTPSVAAPPPTPRPLPDALMGQKWAFVTLDARSFQDLPDWDIGFGETFPLTMAAVDNKVAIPGLLIFSPRAQALAAWMSGLELSHWRIDTGKNPQLVLETGAADSWILASLANPALLAEAQMFETAKRKASRVHFLGVQASPGSESFEGFWLLQDLALG